MTRVFQGTIILALASFCLASLDVTYEWKYIDYVWKNEDQKAKAVEAGTYDHTKIILHDVQPLSDGRVIVTTPKFDHDNPASLSTVSDQTGDGGPLLAPYPDWTWHQAKDCASRIISVNRVVLDDYSRLWLVDSGKIGDEQVCPAKILAFDSTTDKLIKNVEIPTSLSHSPDDETKGQLELQDVESGDTSDIYWLYILDVEGHGLVIYDYEGDIWRLNYAIFKPVSDSDNIEIVNEKLSMPSGRAVLLVFPSGYVDPNVLLFRTQGGPRNYLMPLEQVHNSKSGASVDLYASNLAMDYYEPAKVITKTGGTLFSGFPGTTQYACWNIATAYFVNNTHVLTDDETILQYVSSAKTIVSSDGTSEYLWITSNRWQKYVLGTTDFTEVNYRVMVADVASYVADTVCVLGDVEHPTSIEKHNFVLME